MSFSVGDNVQITATVCVRDSESNPQSINLSNEPALVRKVDGDHLYVETQHGVHYIHESKASTYG